MGACLQNEKTQPKPTAPSSTPLTITPRETQVLVLLAQGNLNKEVARRLNISTETVKKHLQNIYQKTGAQNKIEALNKTRWLTASFSAADTNC